MDRKQKANQIEKLLSKLLFDKRNIKIDVTPISEAQYKTAGYPSWRKYVVNVHVDPFKFNNVTDEYSEEYYDFMIEVEDIISDSVKYIGTDSYELLTTFVIDKKDDFIKMIEKNPDLFKTIAEEIQVKVKGGMNQMEAGAEVMKKYEQELKKLV